MTHECPDCGQICDCDAMGIPGLPPTDCIHCDPDIDEDLDDLLKCDFSEEY